MQGYPIGKGADLFISVWNLHRSPHLWKDPDTFRPERFEEVYTNDAFGGKWAGGSRREAGERADWLCRVLWRQGDAAPRLR